MHKFVNQASVHICMGGSFIMIKVIQENAGDIYAEAQQINQDRASKETEYSDISEETAED